MKQPKLLAGLALAILLVASPLALSAGPQETSPEETEEKPEKEEPREKGPEITPEDLFPEDPVRQEIIELFHKVERKLNEIDGKLLDAGAGDVPVGEVAESGLDDLLRSTGAESQSIVEDIDKILELAAQLGGQSMGSSMSQPSPSQQGESPLDEERDRGPTEREQTPEDPTRPGGEEPQPQEEPNPSQDPTGDQPDEGPGDNKEGSTRNDERGEQGNNPNDANQWGELPVRFRETFRSQGGQDVPVQYRDWIDTYYRRLNRPR